MAEKEEKKQTLPPQHQAEQPGREHEMQAPARGDGPLLSRQREAAQQGGADHRRRQRHRQGGGSDVCQGGRRCIGGLPGGAS